MTKTVKLSWKTRKAVNFLESQAKVSQFIGGVRSSKTFTGAVKGILIALKYPNSLGVGIAPTYAMLDDVLVETYLKLLTDYFGLRQGRDFVYNKSRHNLIIKGGGTIKFRSGDKPERIEGITADWVHEDEAAQMREVVHKICLDRVSRPNVLPRGVIWQTTTPKGFNWVKKLYDLSFVDPDHFAETIYTSEAGLVSLDEIEYARQHMDARYFRQQYQASFESWAGVVYDEFTRKDNVKPLKYRDNLTNYIGIDFGWNDETAILWYQHDRAKGEWYLLSEFVESHIIPETIARVLKGEKVHLARGDFQAPFSLQQVEKIYPGTDVSNHLQVADGLSLRDIMVAQGIESGYFKVKQHRKFEAILSVRAKIRGADGKVRLFVDPSCTRYIADKESYHYAERDGVIIGEVPDTSPENHRYSHTNDAESYVINSVEPVIGQLKYEGIYG